MPDAETNIGREKLKEGVREKCRGAEETFPN